MTALRRRMLEDMRIRNLSPHTQRMYLQYVSVDRAWRGTRNGLPGKFQNF